MFRSSTKAAVIEGPHASSQGARAEPAGNHSLGSSWSYSQNRSSLVTPAPAILRPFQMTLPRAHRLVGRTCAQKLLAVATGAAASACACQRDMYPAWASCESELSCETTRDQLRKSQGWGGAAGPVQLRCTARAMYARRAHRPARPARPAQRPAVRTCRNEPPGRQNSAVDFSEHDTSQHNTQQARETGNLSPCSLIPYHTVSLRSCDSTLSASPRGLPATRRSRRQTVAMTLLPASPPRPLP